MVGGSCGRRDCPSYVDLWCGDNRVRVLENILMGYATEHPEGGSTQQVVMLTLTAPGVDELPWDRSLCKHPPGEPCGGPKGCRVNPQRAREFNEGAMARWSRLWRAVYNAVYREFGPGALRLLAYTPEGHQRGVIHYHLVLGAGTPREHAAALMAHREMTRRTALRDVTYVDFNGELQTEERITPEEVRALPIEVVLEDRASYGWGFVGQRLKPTPAGAAAAYASKYLIKPADSVKPGVRDLVLRGEAPKRAVYVANRLTKRTRCTMRVLRFRRHLHRRGWSGMTCQQAWLVRELEREMGAREVRDGDDLHRRVHAPPPWVAPWRSPELVRRQLGLTEAHFPVRRPI